MDVEEMGKKMDGKARSRRVKSSEKGKGGVSCRIYDISSHQLAPYMLGTSHVS